MNETRIRRVRDLVHRLNNDRRQQAKKIDILCNDMVSAHKDFVKQLTIMTFGVKFYESVLDQPDLGSLLDMAVDTIASVVNNSKVSIFLLRDKTFDIHMANATDPIEVEHIDFESCFTSEVVKEISRATHVCSLDEMCHQGLFASPAILGSISAAAVPLGHVGDPVGFILLHRSVDNKLQNDEIEQVAGITTGLCSAIQTFRLRQSAISHQTKDGLDF